MKTLFALSLILSHQAFAEKAFKCTELNPPKSAVVIKMTVASPTELKNISYTSPLNGQKPFTARVIQGRSDHWKMSPQLGERFYFHSGNTSDFLLFADGILETALKIDGPVIFPAQEISESYESGGSQDITNLICSPDA